MATLKPWYQIVTPREDLRKNRPMDASKFAVHLDHIREGRENVSKDYSDPQRAMLPDGPTLILMDELMNYVSRGRKMGQRDQFFDFLQNLSEEARARKNMVLCVSIPASEFLEMNPDDERDHGALKKLLDRLGKAIMMSAGAEISEMDRTTNCGTVTPEQVALKPGERASFTITARDQYGQPSISRHHNTATSSWG